LLIFLPIFLKRCFPNPHQFFVDANVINTALYMFEGKKYEGGTVVLKSKEEGSK
jgi:hypothetical protein